MGDVDILSTRDKVFAFEDEMRKHPQLNLSVNHYFSEGVYARELHIPKDTILTGEIHKYRNLNILTKGRLKVLVGDVIEEVSAPFIIVSPPGTKRIAMALEDSIWVTIHGTEETDLNKIEHRFIAKSEQEYLEFKQLLLGN